MGRDESCPYDRERNDQGVRRTPLHHRIFPALMPRRASRDSFSGQPHAFEQTVFLQRLIRIVRTTRMINTHRPRKKARERAVVGREGALVGADEELSEATRSIRSFHTHYLEISP